MRIGVAPIEERVTVLALPPGDRVQHGESEFHAVGRIADTNFMPARTPHQIAITAQRTYPGTNRVGVVDR